MNQTSVTAPADHLTARLPPKRIVLTTWGSFGDLHPFIGLGLGLKERGHDVVLATDLLYKEKVEGEGLGFLNVRPNFDAARAPEIIARVMDAKSGTHAVIREMLMPNIRDQYADLTAACRGADLLVTHAIVHSGPLVGEKLGIPWVDAILQPMLLLSAYEPPTPPQGPQYAAIYKLGPWFNRLLLRGIKKRFRSWGEPVDRLRRDEGLPPGRCPIFEAHFSPYLNLALFSRALGAPQPDWPAKTVQCGFPFYDRLTAGAGMAPELVQFLDAGTPPIVFTLGTSAVFTAGQFYLSSIEAVARLGRRAVFLVGTEGLNQLPELSPSMMAVPYAPHSELFSRAAAVVHQGGVGTTGQALRAGKPTLIVPFAHDQPDNAVRVSRHGGARWIARDKHRPDTAERELRRLLEEPAYARCAAAVGEIVRTEDGVGTACAAIEALLIARQPATR